MGSHAALVAKLESAKEGSGKLSCAVLVALGYKYHWRWNGGRWIAPDGSECRIIPQPDPSHDLQDALNLVQLFHSYIDMTIEPEMEGCDRVCLAIIRVDADTRFSSTAATPALALSAANVKAAEAGDG